MEQHEIENHYLDNQDDFGDISGEEDIDSPEIPKEVRKLRTQSYDKSISDLVSMIDDGSLDLDPDYQRNYLWDNKKASLLVESILLNVPIPVIYVAEDDDSKWNVIDGLQRLTSLYRYYKNEYKLTNLEVFEELNGLTYHKLPPKAQRILGNGIIRVIVLLAESHPEIKYDIFMRLNTGSVKLNEQELRNCLYRGAFNNLLRELTLNPNYLKFLTLKEPHKRFVDAELILRFFSIENAYNIETQKINYPGKMKTFLNSYMEKNQKMPKDRIDELRNLFNQTVEKLSVVLGEDAFKRPNHDGSYDNRINRSLIDVTMLCFSKLDYEYCEQNRDLLKDTIRELCNEDDDFIDAITLGTSDKKKLELRLSKGLQTFGLV